LTVVNASILVGSKAVNRRLGVKRRPAPKTIPVDDGLCCPSVVEAPLSEPEAADLAEVLAAMADPVRLRLLSLVAAQGEVCSCDLERPLRRSQPTVSHHTRILADAGLIIGEKRGKWTWWSIVPNRLAAVRRALGA
jgi:ArsR family transcriptional regulator